MGVLCDTKSFAEPLNSECLKKGTGRLLRVGDAGLHERFDLGPYTETSSPPTSSSPISTAMIGGLFSRTSVQPGQRRSSRQVVVAGYRTGAQLVEQIGPELEGGWVVPWICSECRRYDFIKVVVLHLISSLRRAHAGAGCCFRTFRVRNRVLRLIPNKVVNSLTGSPC